MRRVIVITSLALAMFGGPAPSQPPDAGKRYALLVGVREYDHKFKDLLYTEADVVALGQVLEPAGYAVTLLTDAEGRKRPDRRPTGANVRTHLTAVLRACTKRDTVLVAFAGHGLHLSGPGESYFCPADARPDEPATLLSLKDVYQQLDASSAGVKLLFVDACRDDPARARGRGGIDGDTAPRPPRGVAALFSCSAGQVAWESDKLKHGVFFHHVLEGLKGAAKDEEGAVTWDSLSSYVRKRVSREVPTLVGGGATQLPNVIADLSGESPVLVRPGGGRDFTNSLGMRLVRVEPGRFRMGSPEGEVGRGGDEGPHDVTLSRPFFLSTFDTTQAEYETLMGDNPSWFAHTGGGKDKVQGADTARFPVENVSWADAVKFCAKLTERERDRGRTYRLPTEAEWEYACRAGTTTPFWFGAALNGRQANCEGKSPYGTRERGPYQDRTTPVGTYDPNAFGLYDVHGNVWQWCADWYGRDYYQGSARADPKGPAAGTFRVLRGGAWDALPAACRAAYRHSDPPDSRSGNIGFRVACEVSP